MDAGSFETRQRELEWFHGLTVPTGLWTVLRVDGRGFSKLTGTSFDKPFDERFRDHMLAAATALVTDLGAIYGYTQSDEISVTFPPSFDRFGRSVEKLVSISAGLASAAFTHAAGRPAHFDSRILIAARPEDVVDYFSWRQSDANRSALNNWCYWTLRHEGQSPAAATAAITGADTAAKNELLYARGINFNEVPRWQRRGVSLTWREVEHHGVDPRSGAERVVARCRLVLDLELPVRDEFRASVVAELTGAT